MEYKRRLVLGYASQNRRQRRHTHQQLATRYDGGERLWANHAWLKAFVAE